MGEFFFGCKRKKLIKTLKKLGLLIKPGPKHDLAECLDNGGKTTIPRHREIKSEIVKSITDFLLDKEFDKQKLQDLLQ